MAYDQMGAMNQLADEPQGGPPMGGPMTGPTPGPMPSPSGPPPGMAGPGPMAGPQGPQAGNKIDTPAEQKAMQSVVQGAILLREAANLDPSVRYIMDKALLDIFTQITKHYGLEQEGQLALKQAQLTKQRQQSAKFAQPQPPGPPLAA